MRRIIVPGKRISNLLIHIEWKCWEPLSVFGTVVKTSKIFKEQFKIKILLTKFVKTFNFFLPYFKVFTKNCTCRKAYKFYDTSTFQMNKSDENKF